MDRMNNVDLQDALRQIAKANTFYHLENDLGVSIEQMERAMKIGDPADKNLIWIAYPSGIDCYPERQAFQKDTREYNGLLYHANSEAERKLVYTVEITGVKDGAVQGDIFEIDLRQCAQNVRDNAQRSDAVRLFTEHHGEILLSKQAFDDMYPSKLPIDMVGWRNEPTDLAALENLLEKAHALRESSTVPSDIWAHTSKLHDALFAYYANDITRNLSQLETPNSTDKQSFVIDLNSYAANNFGTDELGKLMDALPYKNVRISMEKGQRNMRVIIPCEEIQKEQRKKPSILAKLNEGKKAA